MAFAKKFEVEVTVPEGLSAGDVFKIVVEAPELPKRERGVLNGIALEDMTDEQLKREITNSKSVLYKATKREADQEVIDRAQARVDAAVAEKDKRAATAAPDGVPAGSVASVASVEEAAEDVIDEETAEEM